MNKFLVDDKGVLLLVMFGLPPVYHLDDPVRGAYRRCEMPNHTYGNNTIACELCVFAS